MVDIKKFVDVLVATGMDKTKATDKIKSAVAKIKKEKGDMPDNEVEALISFAISKISSRKGERYKGICIGYENKYDQNKQYADNTLTYFNSEKTKAKTIIGKDSDTGYTLDGVVYGVALKEVDGVEVAVPLDMREYLNPDKTMKNQNFRKPLRSFYKRKCYFVIENELNIVTGNIDPEAGAEYYIYGKKKESGGKLYINVGKSGIQKAASLSNAELWDAIYKFAETSEFAIPLEDVPTIKPNETKLTTGYIKNGGDTRTGGRWAVINNDMYQQGQFGFSTNEDAAAVLSTTLVGNEVFALVRGMKEDPTRDTRAVSILSVIVNPESASNAELIGDIEIFIEGD